MVTVEVHCYLPVGGMMFRGSMRGGMSRGGFAPRGDFGNRPVHSAPPPQLKFDGEFDFETANAQFNKEEIEHELKEKLTVSKYHCGYFAASC